MDAFNDLKNATIDWEDTTDNLEEDPDNVEEDPEDSSFTDEDDPQEVDSSDSDLDFTPRICLRTAAALETQINLNNLPELNLEDTLYDCEEKEEEEEHDDNDEEISTDVTFPSSSKVVCADDIIGVPASIVYHSSLKELVQHVNIPTRTCTKIDKNRKLPCGASKPFEVVVKSKGTAAVVEWICPRGHTVWRWSSPPTLKYGMHAGDFLLSTNILLSGNNFTKVALLFKFMNIKIVNRTTFHRLQGHYCVDTIKDFWETHRKKLIEQLQSNDSVVGLGDGRMDSPGFCAQYCTYSIMENENKQIIAIENIDKRETNRNSVAMEKEGFLRTVAVLCQEVKLTEICTDASPQISALFHPKTGKLKDKGIHHSLDVWHGSKNLSRRLTTVGQQKGCSIIHEWCRDICNHFWHCCMKARDYNEFFDMWAGLLHHVTGVHSWALGFCHHGPLVEQREKHLIDPNSVAHQRLSEVVLDARWLKNIPKYLHFRSTGDLESLHNHNLMYASKRFSFPKAGYSARIHLAALDYNHHTIREARKKKDGSLQFTKLYNKRSRRWRLHTLKVKKEYRYIPELQGNILQKKLTADGGVPLVKKKDLVTRDYLDSSLM
ncbi:uncharacterized protein LOC143718569 [Siphateles boraxobius]|uniref:uncharacterized protein LOC143718569 n=1 Tax=Siphateles boraxobius TaxID=180520 RepID=UPI004064468E